MSIWKREFSLEDLNQGCKNCAIEHLGIEFTGKGDDWLEATMPVNEKTMQPVGILHGGVSAALAETVGSLAGYCCTEEGQIVVGAEINASHLRPAKKGGFVIGKAYPCKIGRTLQVWQIDIRDQDDKLCCVSRLTLSVINHNE